ncbi:MAG: MBOAT family protein, partial [Clostridia bacterium]|nr:MBOAT family protein [Clostridia bacterium]
ATEFWRRWHMSLGTFFRDYVYIPLGGNRHDQQRNILVVWFLTGLWHGASWNFILWGLYYAVLLMWEKSSLLKTFEKMPKPVSFVTSHAYALFVTVFGFAIFYFDTNLLKNLGYLFGFGCTAVTDIFTNSVIFDNLILLLAALFFSVPVIPTLWKKLTQSGKMPYIAERLLKTVAVIGFIAAASIRLVGNSYSAFLYFRF